MEALVDFMRVSPTGDPALAVIAVDGRTAIDVHCDVLVVGGGTGGVSAALAAARHGYRVCLLEETDWLGGQLTAQGVSALDEHPHIERFGGTASYYRLTVESTEADTAERPQRLRVRVDQRGATVRARQLVKGR